MQDAEDAEHSSWRALLDLLSGLFLVGAGLALAYVMFGGAFMSRFMSAGRPSTYDLIVGAIALAFAITAPLALLLLGLGQLVKAYRRFSGRL